MLYVEGKAPTWALVRTNHNYLTIRSKSIAKLVPDVRIVRRYIGEADCCVANSLLDALNRHGNRRISINTVSRETGIGNGWLINIRITLVELTRVERLYDETVWHISALLEFLFS